MSSLIQIEKNKNRGFSNQPKKIILHSHQRNNSHEIKELFRSGMGVDAAKKYDIGAKIPKLGTMASIGSQKHFQRMRDKDLHNGSLTVIGTNR